MTTFWQVFWGFLAAWLVTRLFLNWLVGKLLGTAKKADNLKVEGAERVATAVADELIRRGVVASSRKDGGP